MKMSILPINITTPGIRNFQEIALIIDRPKVEKEIVRLATKWRVQLDEVMSEEYVKDIKNTLVKLRLPSSLYELLSDCVLSGFLWKKYDLKGLEILDTLRLLQNNPRKTKTLAYLRRDRDWYWRKRRGEGYGEIAKKEKVRRQTIINAVKRYKEMIGNR